MTLYYPQGLYGPVCDISDSTNDNENIIRNEIFLDDPNINPAEGEDGTGGGGTSGTISFPLSPKICRTVQVKALYSSGTYGPVCDILPAGQNSSVDICIEPVDFLNNPVYNPIPKDDLLDPRWTAFLPVSPPNLECEVDEYELYLEDGSVQNITYYKNCVPVIEDWRPNLDDPDWNVPKKSKPKYTYGQSLICGKLDYYSSPGIYDNYVPQGINALQIIAMGAGGGAGGGDAANGPSGSGNNSGGTGSFAYITITVDSSISNTLRFVVGGGGNAGRSYVNDRKITPPGYNRGGSGGHAAPVGRSGAGGAGGGSTDVYLNGRLIMSIAGGGGGGGNGCNYFVGSSGKPWANWNQLSFGGNTSVTSAALKRSRFSDMMAYNMFDPPIKHSLWSNWFKDYVVWFNEGEITYDGMELENRVNLNFSTSGTYTFQMMGDNQVAVYIAPWYDPGEGTYITDILHNGSFNYIVGDGVMTNSSGGLTTPPASIPAGISGASNWTRVGWTTDFTSSSPASFTYNISTPGRYVLKILVANEYRAQPDWLKNPSGIALKILNPNGSTLWTTREGFGAAGESRTQGGDGPGAGGGGGNGGSAGLSSIGMGLGSNGGCTNSDSTAQGGSAGWNYIINHPSVSIEYFAQAPSTFHAGWNTPTYRDASIRQSGGGLGGSRPKKFKFIYNGVEYPLYTNTGAYTEVTIPGMGQGVWEDFMNGKSFNEHYFYGVAKDGGKDTLPQGLTDGTLGYLFFGSYQGEYNSSASQRSSLYRGRNLELALQWTPIKVGNTWSTKVRLIGTPRWGKGTGFDEGDILPGVMPPSKSQGTQPWWDIITAGKTWHQLYFYDSNDKKTKLAVKPGTSFSFAFKVVDVLDRDDYTPMPGDSGFVRSQYLTTDIDIEPVEDE